MLLGGRAAEQSLFDGDVSTGAADDLQRATEIALEMVTRHGMNATVGQRTYATAPQTFLPGARSSGIQVAESTAREIDVAVRDIIAEAFDRAVDILKSRRADLDRGAQMLLNSGNPVSRGLSRHPSRAVRCVRGAPATLAERDAGAVAVASVDPPQCASRR